jgi:ATP-dependent RNA helicase DDX5/DBP2
MGYHPYSRNDSNNGGSYGGRSNGGGYGGGGRSYGNNNGGGGGSYGRGGSFNRPNNRGGGGGYNDITHIYNPTPSFDNLEPFKKDFYNEDADVAQLSEKDISEFRTANQMVLTGKNIPRPMMTFKQANWPQAVLSQFEKSGYDKPTPIQCQGFVLQLL